VSGAIRLVAIDPGNAQAPRPVRKRHEAALGAGQRIGARLSLDFSQAPAGRSEIRSSSMSSGGNPALTQDCVFG